ncbi:uncharacterized protein V1510DRAFT_418880 [Dipodascopsis tothii]|uniref:uncharacterized protein n=1 Tax=Dipodascopsis tothii TaxID=44089 RepID=UPI0034CF4510
MCSYKQPVKTDFAKEVQILGSIVDTDHVAGRLKFDGDNRFNPTILPVAKTSRYDYIGLVRYDPAHEHEMYWCYMRWTRSESTGRRVLSCATQALQLKSPDLTGRSRCGEDVGWLNFDQGLNEGRLFFSPAGEPLLTIASNSQSQCMSIYVVDLRKYIPGLEKELGIGHVPIRFDRFVELYSPPPANMIEKNWMLLYDPDDSNELYVHQNMIPRKFSSLANPLANQVGSDGDRCLQSLRSAYPNEDPDNEENTISVHQGTNMLRVTMCEFPCEPTVHNTVLVSIVHVKLRNGEDIQYRRHSVVMNSTYPFDIMGYSPSLLFAGLDTSVMTYSVTMAWDTKARTRPAYKDVGEAADPEPVAEEEPVLKAKPATAKSEAKAEVKVGAAKTVQKPVEAEKDARRRRVRRDESGNSGESKPAVDPDFWMSTGQHAPWISSSDLEPLPKSDIVSRFQTTPEGERPSTNPFVSDFYHGWIDDHMIVTFGVSDQDSGFIQIDARQLFDCIRVC